MELKLHDHEILLQRLWKSRKLFSQNLRTTAGQSVEVIFAGRENLDAGPDFKEAVLKLDGRLLKGDVEVHLEPRGWYEHGHHRDAAYNRVILHLITRTGHHDFEIEREDGVIVPQVCIDIETYKKASWKQDEPPKTRPGTLVVENCPLSRQPESRIYATVDAAMLRRLEEKAQRLREAAASLSWDQLIYLHLMEALGYAKNQAPFRHLAKKVPFELICREMQWVPESHALQKCAALLFGAAGLLPRADKVIGDGDALAYVSELRALWDRLAHRLEMKPMQPAAWQFFRLRPQNFPTRRIAGLVQLIYRFLHTGFLDGLLKIVSGVGRKDDLVFKELERALTVGAEGFWRERYLFEEEPRDPGGKQAQMLIGKSRAREMVVNVVLPVLYLYAEEAQDGVLHNQVKAVYQAAPRLSENAITRAMMVQLFGEKNAVKAGIRSAGQQQALIFLHKLYCRSLRCQECLALANSPDAPAH